MDLLGDDVQVDVRRLGHEPLQCQVVQVRAQPVVAERPTMAWVMRCSRM